jgi:hypothetical protein
MGDEPALVFGQQVWRAADSSMGGDMRYEVPKIVDYGSIQAHTFTNTGQVPGVGPTGKDWRTCDWDKFNEESCGEHS